MRNSYKRALKSKVDDITIFCHKMRMKGLYLKEIAALLNKDHSTISYHLVRYGEMEYLSNGFKIKIKNFNEEEFLSKLRNEQIEKSGSNG